MDQAKAERIVQELQQVTKIIFSREVAEFKPSPTLLERSINPSEVPFIKKDASGRALFFIIEGSAGVDIGQPERIVVPQRRTVGEMSLISTMLKCFSKVETIESRTADVYAEEPMRVIVFNYGSVVQLLEEDDPVSKKFHGPILICLNRIIYRKLMEVNQNFFVVMLSRGGSVDDQVMSYPFHLREDMNRFLRKMRSIPNLQISPHDMHGILIQQGQPNSSLVFLEKGKVRVSLLGTPDEEGEGGGKADLHVVEAPMILGESSLLNVGAIASAQVETVGTTLGYKIAAQNVIRHLQRYPDLFLDFFKLLLELNNSVMSNFCSCFVSSLL